jgi:serine/threonine-protein kinase HipA|tara:strand:- start:710 stop:1939 length:1230 start_codon:yes stop_codon:yes gene_type:complete
MPDTSTLGILLHGRPIGALTWLGGDRTIFAFNDVYIEDPDRHTLSLSFKDEFGGLIRDFRPTQTRLIPFFSNLLPEGRMRSYLAELAGVNAEREFFLLRALGEDLPGAVTVRAIDASGAVPEPEEILPWQDAGTDRPAPLHFSLAGVQLKFSAFDERGGLTIPVRGVGGDMIVKLPSLEFEGVPENEFSMMELARMIGIDVPETRLLDISDIGNLPDGIIGSLRGRAFAIRRFDRPAAGGALHIEDFAQVFGVYPDAKYKKASARNIAAVVAAESGGADTAEFIRRLTFNTLIGNADMHLKNWSMAHPIGGASRLAPAYDFISTIAYIKDDQAALKVSRSKRFADFSEDELSHLAAKAGLPQKLVLDTAHETASLFREHWEREKKHLPMARHVVETIDAHLQRVPIAGN